jgi:hypothetical protein
LAANAHQQLGFMLTGVPIILPSQIRQHHDVNDARKMVSNANIQRPNSSMSSKSLRRLPATKRDRTVAVL